MTMNYGPTPMDNVNSKLRTRLDEAYGGGGSAGAGVAPAAQSPDDALSLALANGEAYVGTDGLVYWDMYGSGDFVPFTKAADGSYQLYIEPKGGGGGGGGGTDNTVGMANVGLGYAGLAQDDAHFRASQAQEADQFDRSLQQGAYEFDQQFSRNNFESDRAYEEARYQYATSFAENQRQFDLGYGLDTRALDLDTELGRGGLEVDRGRLALDDRLGTGYLANDTSRVGIERDRLSLDDRLGTGRLNLDTELGRGALEVDRGHLGVARGRLAMDDRLGTGRLNLDTRLGEGGLRLDADRLGFDKKRTDRDQRLEENKFRAEVLRNPSDYVFRAFESRGQESPTGARITQADVLNSLAGRYARGGYGDDALFLTGEEGPELVANHGDGSFSVADAEQTQRLMGGRLGRGSDGLRIQPAEPPPPRRGKPVHDVPPSMPAASRMGDRPGFMDWYNGQRAQRAGGWRSRMYGEQGAQPPVEGFNPREFAEGLRAREDVVPAVRRLMGASEEPIAGYAAGTDDQFFAELDSLSGFQSAPIPTFNQDELVNAARKYSPPEVTAALEGRAPGAYRPVSRGLTLGRLGRMTTSGQEALNTRLGVEFNTTLRDEMEGLQSRFGAVRSAPMARMAV